MATSKNPPSVPTGNPRSQGLGSGDAAVSGSMPAPKSPSKSKEKSRPPEGKAAEAKPAVGSTTAKPLPKTTASDSGQGAPPAAPQARDPAGSATGDTAGASATSRPAGAGSADSARSAAGVGQAAGTTSAPAGARLSDAERQRRIAEAAYRKAQERGFSGGRQLDDWLDAERELDEGEGRQG